MGFNELCGNESVKKSLENAVLKDRVSNSYVFEGKNGVGKGLCAEIFARSLVCEGDEPPCDVCSACKKAKSYNHPDIIYVEKPKDKASIGVDEIREKILGEVYLKPYLAKRRVFIIKDGDILSDEAQNALLKVLEEPPENVSFIICVTSQDKLLSTVLSRSFVISFFPLSFDEVFSFLSQKYGDTEESRLIARLSQGSIGEAVSLMSDEKSLTLFEESVKNIMNLAKDASKVRFCADFMIEEKENIGKVTDFFLTFIRDCVLVKTGLENLVIYENKLSDMRVFCDGISKKSLILAFGELTDFKLRLAQNLNYSASVLDTVMHIWEDFHDKGSGHKI